ncbi:tumor necrosis factor alpha-induced protein 3 [Hydra vulgaris]|uniref:Tumor necrosis factor alpha-induced protein 3 n=1 Tax=Hydra vulgaris TaxID=6087 RepID=A0ABM4BLT5_HYDVU
MSGGILKKTLSSSSTSISNEIHNYIKFQTEFFLSNDMTHFDMDEKTSTVTIPNDIIQKNLKILCDEIKLEALVKNCDLNWCKYARPLCPINTENDGNSLLHSLSLYIFGVHDRYNYFRQILSFRINKEKLDGQMGIRWIEHSQQSNLLHDWNRLQELTSNRKYFYPDKTIKYGELGNFHIFVMANILGRPIIVLSEKQFDNVIGGIYLPLLRHSKECFRSPIVLVYYNYNFSPAFSCESFNTMLSNICYDDNALHCVPLVNNNLMPLKVHFLLPSENQDKVLLGYLDISYIEEKIKVAFLKFKSPLANSVKLINLFSKNDFDENVPNVFDKSLIDTQYSANFTQGSSKMTYIGNESSIKKNVDNSSYISAMSYSSPLDLSDKKLLESETQTLTRTKLQTADSFGSSYYQNSVVCIGCDKNFFFSDLKEYSTNLCKKCFLEHQQIESAYSKEYHTQGNNLLKHHVDLTPCSTIGCPKLTYLPSGKCQKCEMEANRSGTFDSQKCLISGCKFYGNPNFNGLCSECFMKMTMSEI